MIVRKLHEFSGHKDCLYTAAMNASEQKCYTAGGDGMVVAWDGLQGGDGAMIVRVGTAVYSMCLNQTKLLLGNRTGNLFVIDLITKTEVRNIEAHTQGVFDIIVDEEKQWIYTCGFDGFLNVWDQEYKLLTRKMLSSKSLRSICLLPHCIAVASSDFTIYLLEKETFNIIATLKHHTNSVFALAYNPLKNELLSGGRDCFLKIWDTNNFELKQEYVGATLHINHISFNPDFTLYAVSSMDKTIKVFDAQTHKALKFISKESDNGHTSSINKSSWLNKNTLFSVSDDKKAMVWSLE